MNKFLVGADMQGNIFIGLVPTNPITANDAITLAAWLVALASTTATIRFEDVLREVEES